MIILIGALYVLIRIWASGGQETVMLWRAACLFSELNAFVASTRSTASELGVLKISLIAWTAASHPPSCPAHTCKGPAASSMSQLITLSTALAIIRLGTSINQPYKWAHQRSAYAQLSPLYSSLYPYVTPVINYPRPSPAFPYCKWRKAGQASCPQLRPCAWSTHVLRFSNLDAFFFLL